MALRFVKEQLRAATWIAAAVAPMGFSIINAPQSHAQTAAVAKPRQVFDVASIKPTDPSDRVMWMNITPGVRFTARGMTIRFLIREAYDVHDFQISGGPDWINSARYDIAAKAEDSDEDAQNRKERDGPLESLRQRLQSLLADRFQLKFHYDTKELPIYVLVIGKNTSNLRIAKDGENGLPALKGRNQFMGRGMSMSVFASSLSHMVGREVVDKTGLTGRYDFEFEFNPDIDQVNTLGGPFVPGPDGKDAPPPAEQNGPSIFTALQTQLGLKLKPQKGPVKIMVIDQLQKPSKN